jgi:hypothetical protein
MIHKKFLPPSQNYIDAAAEAGMMPCWTAICERYKHSNKALCTAQLPTLTLPNIAGNTITVTPQPPALTSHTTLTAFPAHTVLNDLTAFFSLILRTILTSRTVYTVQAI